MTATVERASPQPVEPGAEAPGDEDKRLSRWVPALGIMVVWIVVWSFTKGTDTLALRGLDQTDLHKSLTGFNNDLLASRDTNPVMQATNAIAEVLRSVVDWLRRLVSRPALPRKN